MDLNGVGNQVKNSLSGVTSSISSTFSSVGGSDPFYMYVTIGAIILLLIVLISIGIMMTTLKSLDKFPPLQNTCPDYWDISSNPAYCVYPYKANSVNQGINDIKANATATVGPVNSGDKVINGNIGYVSRWATHLGLKSVDGNVWTTGVTPSNASNHFIYLKLNDNDSGWGNLAPGKTTRCAQKSWAIQNGIVWDGVTNYNAC
jgi:hypothetical protein